MVWFCANGSSNAQVSSASTNGATASIPFAGNAVYLYGPIGSYGQMSVTIDLQNKIDVNCTSSVTQSQVLLVRFFHIDYRALTDISLEVLLR